MPPKAAGSATMDKMRKGLALQQAGDYEKAQRIYKSVLKKNPDLPDANHLLGVTYRQLGFPKRGLDYIQKAIRLAPGRGPFYANLARTLSDMEGTDPEDVLAAAETAVSLDKSLIEAWNLKAITLAKLDREEEAEDILKQLVKEAPRHADTQHNYAVLLRDQNRHKEAVEFFDKAIRLNPGNVENYVQRARARFEVEDFKTSRAELYQAILQFPGNGDLHHEMARLLFKIGETFEGLPHAMAAVEFKPDDHHTLVTLAVQYQSLGEFKKAEENLKRAIDLAPGPLPVAEWNLALSYLAQGNFEKGWALHHMRFDDASSTSLHRTFDVPRWEGEDISDKTILVWNDQGLGDAFRSASILPELQARAGRIILEPPLKSMPLMERSFPDMTVRPQTHDRLTLESFSDGYDVEISLGDLACHFRKKIEDFQKAKHPVLKVDPDRVQELYSRIPDRENKPIVGLAWRSGQLDAWRARWYLSIVETRAILETPDVVFVNLQYGALDKELRWVREKLGVELHAWDDVDLKDDLDSAAALTVCCDLVISSNTSVADIAGAVNVPCWRFGPPNATPLLGQKSPPWFPSMTYYRISGEQRANEVVPTLQEDLVEWMESYDPGKRVACQKDK